MSGAINTGSSATPQLTKTDPISSLTSILDLISGGSKTVDTGPSSSTTKGNLSNDQMTQLIQQILGGSQGLASVAMGQKQAGGYNSTVNQQMINDLLSRVTTQVAAANAGTTTTKSGETQKTTTPSLAERATSPGVGATLGLGALGWLLGPSAKAAAKKTGLSDLPSSISDAIFGGGNTLSAASAGEAMQSASDLALQASSGDWEIGAKMAEAFGNGSDLSALGDMGDLPIGSTLKAASAIGDFLGGNGSIGDAAPSIANAGLAYATGGISSITDMLTGGAVSSEVSHISDVASDFVSGLGDSLGSIICTELHRQGKMTTRHWILGAKSFSRYDEKGKKGYYFWAHSAVAHLRAHPTSLFSSFLRTLFNARANYVCSLEGDKKSKKTLGGFLATHSLYWFCWILSRTLARNYQNSGVISAGTAHA